MLVLTSILKANIRSTRHELLKLILIFLLSVTPTMATQAASNQPLLSQFNLGCAADNFSSCTTNSQIVAGPWVLSSWQEYHSQWLNNFKSTSNLARTPYIYSYIIAGMARSDWGLQDCNMSTTNNLCQRGAVYIRSNQSRIDQAYRQMAENLRNEWGTSRPLLLHMEPDFYQYFNDVNQAQPLTQAESWQFMNSWVAGIKSVLPNAVLVMDVSPWNQNLAGWSSGFTGFDYAGMVGKRFAADQAIDGKTYQQMFQMTGKKLIVNGTYAAGGAMNSFDFSWTPRQTLQDRWNDGVAAIIQSPDQRDYYSSLIQSFQNLPIR